MAAPVYRTRVEMPLADGLGSVSFSLVSKLLGAALDDGCSNATDISDPREIELSKWGIDESSHSSSTHSGTRLPPNQPYQPSAAADFENSADHEVPPGQR